MQRFMLFVDGSNLYGVLKDLAIEVDDYEAFYRLLYERAVDAWSENVLPESKALAQLRRVYWYSVGSIDTWDLTEAKAQATLKEWYDKSKELRSRYMPLAAAKIAGKTQDEIAKEAWAMCFNDAREWYEGKVQAIEGMQRFYHSVRSQTNCIDIADVGHWKADLLNHYVQEKGLDTALAVDMVAYSDNYDVGVLVCGDADALPSMRYLKSRDKQIVAVEFVRGYPPEKRGRGFSSKMKLTADFVIRIYEMELVTKGFARKV